MYFMDKLDSSDEIVNMQISNFLLAKEVKSLV